MEKLCMEKSEALVLVEYYLKELCSLEKQKRIIYDYLKQLSEILS